MSNDAGSPNRNIPDNPVEKLRDVVAGLIDVVATQGNKAIDTFGLRTGARSASATVDVVETHDDVLVYFDLPGVDPNQVEILLTGNMLTVKGEQPAVEIAAGDTVHRRERTAGPFCRSIPLPVSVDSEQVTAESRYGVLTIRVRKAAPVQARHVPIEIRSV